MLVVEFFKAHPADAILMTLILIVIIVLIVTGKWKALKKAALYAVNVAEDEWIKPKYGLIKKAQVITYLRTTFPIVTAFIPDKILDDLIEGAVILAKEIWKKAKEALE